MRVSILDQSSLSEEATASDAILSTLRVAETADRLGFYRIWLSEHHNLPVLQGSSPEVLLAAVGARTGGIRIGSGGVLLPNHNPYRVAEVFRTLEALYPGRVDCGLGRASGGNPFPSVPPVIPSRNGDTFPDQLEDLDRFFHDAYRRAMATPNVRSVPPIWLLSSGGHPRSGDVAAERGLGLALALFINPFASPEAVSEYRRRFMPSESFAKPAVLLALNLVCAQSPRKLAELKKTSDYFRIMRDSGRYPTYLPSPQTLSSWEPAEQEREHLLKIANREVVGSPETVAQDLRDRAELYQADEVMLTMMCYGLEDKLQTLEAIAQVFDLGRRV